MVAASSTVLLQRRGLLANAPYWLAAGSGSADQVDVGSRRPTPRRATLGSRATGPGGPAWVVPAAVR